MEIRHKSMKAFGNPLSEADEQLKILNNFNTINFDDKYLEVGDGPLTAGEIEIFQINLGKMCNQVCKHCHVDAGPDRREIMTKETMKQCLTALESVNIPIVDLTGGAPEMNPLFKWFVSEIKKLNRHVIVRSNLTIMDENNFRDMPQFLAENNVEIVSSLPFYNVNFTDKQRGTGVFDKSIKVIQKLNELGYGKDGSGLIFNLVYNPAGAFLPPSQASLEKDYKRELGGKFGLTFNNLFTITNMPISRYLEYLIASNNYEEYINKLINAFNPIAAKSVMCKFTLSVGWDGYIYDCDFNQMLNLKVNHGMPNHINDFDSEKLKDREIITGVHCYGCTAGSGSSCGGATT